MISTMRSTGFHGGVHRAMRFDRVGGGEQLQSAILSATIRALIATNRIASGKNRDRRGEDRRTRAWIGSAQTSHRHHRPVRRHLPQSLALEHLARTQRNRQCLTWDDRHDRIDAAGRTQRRRRRQPGRRNQAGGRSEKSKAAAQGPGRSGRGARPGRARRRRTRHRRLLRHVPPADIAGRGPATSTARRCRCGSSRAPTPGPGRQAPRLQPRSDGDGWSSPHTIVEIVNDDMPFLVDSVTAALNGEGANVRL